MEIYISKLNYKNRQLISFSRIYLRISFSLQCTWSCKFYKYEIRAAKDNTFILSSHMGRRWVYQRYSGGDLYIRISMVSGTVRIRSEFSVR